MSSLIDSKIATCKSWNDFEQLVAAHSKTKDKGDLFERLTQLFLQTSTTYTSKIKQVWWCNNPYTNEFPEEVRRNLNLPEGDEGIDLICETFEGTYWSVQAKYRTDNDKALTTKELSKFLSLSFVTSDKIELGLITHTSTKPVRKQGLMGQTTELGLQNFLEMSPEQWEQIAGICAENAPQPPPKRKPHPFQETAIAEAVTHFQTRDNARGKLIMPCGTGKSLMAYWMAREMNAKSIILAVPSLALVKQSLGDWTADLRATLIEFLETELTDLNFGLYGQNRDTLVQGRAYIDLLSECRMAINFSRYNDISLYSSDRQVHLAANGCLTFTPDTPNTRDLFSAEEMVYFNDFEDLKNKIMYYHAHPDEGRLIAKAGHARAHHDYECQAVTAQMMDKIFS